MTFNGSMAGRLMVVFFVLAPLGAEAQSNPMATEGESGEEISEELRLTRREGEIRARLKALAQEQQELQQKVLEGHRQQYELQQKIFEDDKEIAALRQKIAEAEKDLEDLRTKLAQAVSEHPEFAEIKARRDEAFARRSEILREENALSEELVRVGIRLRQLKGELPSESESETP